MRKLLAMAVMTFALAPVPALADGFVVPFGGANSAGDIGNGSRGAYGVALGAMGGGVVGIELDFGVSPNFFPRSATVSSSNVTTSMGNLIVGAPLGSVRPYVSAGVGLIKARVGSAGDLLRSSSNDFGTNIGGGLMAFVNPHVGLRGDVRVFRDLKDRGPGGLDPGSFHFWRGTMGVAFRF